MDIDAVLHLIPTPLGENGKNEISGEIRDVLEKTDYFFVESMAASKNFLKRQKINIKKTATFCPMYRPISEAEKQQIKLLKIKGGIGAILSDAGCPGIADPGSEIVNLAHKEEIKVIPQIGPSSILLALMASGVNGQQFTFRGYLPKERQARRHMLTALNQVIDKTSESQIFIETPHRNQHLMEDILEICRPQIHLCIAIQLTQPDEWIRTKSIEAWGKNKLQLPKKPAIFILGKTRS